MYFVPTTASPPARWRALGYTAAMVVCVAALTPILAQEPELSSQFAQVDRAVQQAVVSGVLIDGMVTRDEWRQLRQTAAIGLSVEGMIEFERRLLRATPVAVQAVGYQAPDRAAEKPLTHLAIPAISPPRAWFGSAP